MHPEPPPITITDPNRPAGADDVLVSGNEREPWRPSRRHWQLLGAVLAVLAVTVPVVLVVQHRREQARLDRAALAAVRLVAVLPQEANHNPPPDTAPLGLRNDGPDDVRVLSLRIDAAGYRDQAVGRLVEGGVGFLALDVANTPPCDARLVTAPPRTVIVTLRTERGDRTTRRLPLDAELARLLSGLARDRCGYQAPADALQADLAASHADGADLVATFQVYNRSVLPLTLLGLEGPGLRITTTPALPLALTPQRSPNAGTLSQQLTVRVRVTDCARALPALGGLGDSPFGPDMLLARLHGRYEDGAAPLLLDTLAFETGAPGDLPPVAGTQQLLTRCSPPGGPR
ncbi:MAG: hypothetical protein WCD35_16995 [Mycobacteriales bacterium]